MKEKKIKNINVKRLYQFCKKHNLLNYTLVEVYIDYIEQIECISNITLNSLIKDNKQHNIYNCSDDDYIFNCVTGEYEKTYDKNTDKFIIKKHFNKKSITVKEYYQWARRNNCLDYEIYAEPIEAMYDYKMVLRENYICVNKERKRIELHLN